LPSNAWKKQCSFADCIQDNLADSFYSSFIRLLPAGLAHQLAPFAITHMANRMPQDPPTWKPLEWKNLHFPNRLGIAGGVDKNAELLISWPRLGVGFIEVGTVTPYSQKANPGKILDRDWDNKNLWNKMGFPNHGSDEMYFNILRDQDSTKVPLFINIGKNRTTPNEYADNDYLYLAERFAELADALVINVSSPNTQGLRDLQASEALARLTQKVVKLASKTPVLVKLSPDLSEGALKESLKVCIQSGISGFILTNTTLSRPAHCPFPKEGGLSGKDLAELSKKSLRIAIETLGADRHKYLLVSTGGVLNPQDVAERLEMGADLVQTYSALVFHGPSFFRDVAATMMMRS
jgi:dihydroorotate dehydrogenase